MKVKVNGAWKETAGQWVKVNGVWKQVDSMSTKVNGVWKQELYVPPKGTLFNNGDMCAANTGGYDISYLSSWNNGTKFAIENKILKLGVYYGSSSQGCTIMAATKTPIDLTNFTKATITLEGNDAPNGITVIGACFATDRVSAHENDVFYKPAPASVVREIDVSARNGLYYFIVFAGTSSGYWSTIGLKSCILQ